RRSRDSALHRAAGRRDTRRLAPWLPELWAPAPRLPAPPAFHGAEQRTGRGNPPGGRRPLPREEGSTRERGERGAPARPRRETRTIPDPGFPRRRTGWRAVRQGWDGSWPRARPSAVLRPVREGSL